MVQNVNAPISSFCVILMGPPQMSQVEELAGAEDCDNDTTRERWHVKVDHLDLGPGFWRKHPWIMANCT